MTRRELKEDFIGLLRTEGSEHYAIAIAILELADETSHVASGLRMLGTNDAATQMGAIEHLAKEVKGIADVLASGLESLTNAA